MQLISFNFAALAFLSILIYYLISPKYRATYLSILSCGFIGSFSINLLILVLLFTIFNYYFGLLIPESKNKKLIFRIGIIVNLTQLFVLKYASFAIDPVLNIFSDGISISRLGEIVIPIGISYFTLQGIGYLINIKMGWEKPENNFFRFLLFITFYPKFISGPIERSNHFIPQLKNEIAFNQENVTSGLRIALLGFFKKVVIANQLGSYIMGVYSDPGIYGGNTLLSVILVQPLYLYFDFSGYTDIAIGLSRTFGINLLPNFNRPFLAQNVTTFWKRFHMSLSLWFNDYIFKQASFKYRKLGKYASVLSVFLTFTLFGIWHGAGWNFMLLGFLQAVAINYEFFTRKIRYDIFSKLPVKTGLNIGRTFTYLFYGISLVFFFSPDIGKMIDFFSGLTEFGSKAEVNYTKEGFVIAMFLAICFILAEIFDNDYKNILVRFERFWISQTPGATAFRWTAYIFMITAIILFNNRVQQFIYFKF